MVQHPRDGPGDFTPESSFVVWELEYVLTVLLPSRTVLEREAFAGHVRGVVVMQAVTRRRGDNRPDRSRPVTGCIVGPVISPTGRLHRSPLRERPNTRAVQGTVLSSS